MWLRGGSSSWAFCTITVQLRAQVLRVGAETRETPSLHIQHILFGKLRYLTKTQLDFSIIYSLVHSFRSSQNTRGGGYCNPDDVMCRRVSLQQCSVVKTRTERIAYLLTRFGRKIIRLGIYDPPSLKKHLQKFHQNTDSSQNTAENTMISHIIRTYSCV